MLPVTSLFAGLFTLYFVGLARAVIRLRRANKVALGAGGVNELEGAIRAHGNFAEYVPLGLILLGLLEAQGLPSAFVAVLGGAVCAGADSPRSGTEPRQFEAPGAWHEADFLDLNHVGDC